LPITLHGRAEIVNSIALAVFRRAIDATTCQEALDDLERDLAGGRLYLVDLLWRKTLERSTELSRQHTPKLGTRTLDVLHVASASYLDCRTFGTYGDRQAALAKAAGLRVLQP
jgi:hypothetical protein